MRKGAPRSPSLSRSWQSTSFPGGLPEQELDLGVNAAEFVGRPLLHHVVKGWVQAQQELLWSRIGRP